MNLCRLVCFGGGPNYSFQAGCFMFGHVCRVFYYYPPSSPYCHHIAGFRFCQRTQSPACFLLFARLAFFVTRFRSRPFLFIRLRYSPCGSSCDSSSDAIVTSFSVGVASWGVWFPAITIPWALFLPFVSPLHTASTKVMILRFNCVFPLADPHRFRNVVAGIFVIFVLSLL